MDSGLSFGLGMGGEERVGCILGKQLTCNEAGMRKGPCFWDETTLHLYRNVLYFANLLLCSAAILPKERGIENQERTVRKEIS